MRAAIVVFAKTPGLSPVKTRLAADIGDQKAEAFYRRSLKGLKAVLDALDEDIQVKIQNDIQQNAQKNTKNDIEKALLKQPSFSIEIYWALAEKEGASHELWDGFQTIWTGDGDLGTRLDRVTTQLFERFDQVIMLGTDSPQIDADLLGEAVHRLMKAPQTAVVGPCPDGGFYLFGSTEPLGSGIWNRVTYSQDDTLKQLMNRLKDSNINVSALPEMTDADTGSDLEHLICAFKADKPWKPEQVELFHWLCDMI